MLIRSPKEKEFEQLFRDNYNKLYGYAQLLVPRQEEAKDIVSAVFADLWARFDTIDTTVSVTPLLYKLVYTKCIDYIRRQKVVDAYLSQLNDDEIETDFFDYPEADLRVKQIKKAVEALPPQAKTAFQKCIIQDKSYKEAADEMQVSINTIKTHMLRALRFVRSKVQLNS